MITAEPDPHLNQALTKQAEGHRVTWTLWYRKRRSEIAEKSSITGSAFTADVVAAALEAIESAAKDIERDVLGAFQEIHSRIPPEMMPWIREFCAGQIDPLSTHLGDDVAAVQKKYGDNPASTIEAIGRLRYKLARELDFTLVKQELRGRG